ncbi:MAG: T9SS type A sorting domain-containing protein [Bacteroidia bacterium]|nr:T9SS type A sorting domain-containing protein [Bacteroidia bacterium]
MKKLILIVIGMHIAYLNAQSSLQDSMMLFMPFAGNTSDLGPNNIQTTNTSINLTTDNRTHQGHAYQFNGISSKINWNFKTSMNVQFPITVSAWVYLEDSALNSPIYTSDAFSTAYAGFFRSVNAGKLSFGYGNGIGAGTQYRRSAESVANVPSKKWFHVIGVLEAKNSIKLYINNQLQQIVYTGTSGVNLVYKGGDGAIGFAKNYFGTPDLFLKGKIADIGVWNRVLNHLERQQLANLVLWYEFENDLNDKSSYLNKGAIGTNINYGKDRFGIPNSSLQLKGGSFLQLPTDSTYRSDLPVTISFWVRPDTILEYQCIVNTSNNLNTMYSGLSIDLNTNTLNASINNGVAAGPNHRRSYNLSDTLKVGHWYHVVVEFNDRTPLDSIKIYLNGQQQVLGQYSGTGQKLGYSTLPGYIGKQTNPFGVDKNFIGCVDNLQIYNAAMGASIVSDQFSPSLYLEKDLRDTSILKGAMFSFSCFFRGVGEPTYRWQRYISGNWTDVPGAFKERLNFSSVSEQDTGLYRCVAACFNLTLSTTPVRLSMHTNTNIDLEKVESIRLYPNPGNGVFYINSNESELEVSLIDFNGKSVLLKSDASNAYALPQNLLNGFYIIRVAMDSDIIYYKYIKID